MKKIVVTYDVMVIEDGQKVFGETCITLQVMDYVAKNLVVHGHSGVAERQIEKAISALETLKGRHYVEGSVKHYAYAN